MHYREFLAEMPYLNLGSMKLSKQTSYSEGALSRDFSLLSDYQTTGGTLKVLIHKRTNMVIGVEENQNQQTRHNCVFSLLFKDTVTFDYDLTKAGIHGTVLQVDRVELHDRFQAIGFCSSVYHLLVELGYVIVSDSTQFEPAQAMWKKLAASGRVIVFDVDHGPFKDADGKIVEYDGKNISDHDVWTTGSNFDGYHRLLCLTK